MSRFRRRLMGLAALRQAAADDFVRVEYIENTSTAYINTGLYGNTNISVDLDIEIYNPNNIGIWGNRNKNNAIDLSGNRSCGLYIDSTPNFALMTQRTKSVYAEYTPIENTRYKCVGTSKSTTITFKELDEETQEYVTTSFTLTNAGTAFSNKDRYLYLLNINQPSLNTSLATKGKIFACKIYQSGTLVRDYIPMYQISTDTYGLWDRVKEEFYTSPNGVKFTGGERVIADADDNLYYFRNYISTYNTQRYLNTGLYANSTDYWETKVYLASGRNYAFGGWSANNSNMYGIHANSNTISFVYGSGGINYSVNYANKIFTLKQTFDDETQTMHFYVYDSSGKLVWSNQIAKRGGAASKAFYIGNYNGSTYGSTNGTRFYYFKYYRNGELIREYIPVQSCEDGVYGFFDKVNLRIYYSNGSQDFTGA